jgi:hypothetical protein
MALPSETTLILRPEDEEPLAAEQAESTNLDHDPEPGSEWTETFTPAQVLAFVRSEAALRDPRHARIYETADPSRIKDGIDTLRAIVSAHLEFHQRTGRGAKSGRRAHAAAIRTAVLATNEVTFTLGLIWLELAFGLLPPSSPPEDD